MDQSSAAAAKQSKAHPEGIALVVGGSGFLGSALVRSLCADGVQVRSFDLTPTDVPGVDAVIGDLRRPETIEPALRGVTTIYQSASYVGWSARDADLIFTVNVDGNRNILRAAQAAGIPRFVYTSSIDAVFDGTPIRQGDESLPYPDRFLNAYSEAKAVAEQDVLAANGKHGVLTCALRAAGIFGPGDRHRLPNVLRNAQAGNSLRLGDGSATFNHVYVDNVVYAHRLAAAALQPGSPVPGEAYFIVDAPPSNFFDFMEPFLEALDYPLPTSAMPHGLARVLANLAEGMQKVPLIGQAISPQLTRYIVASTCVDFNFTHAKATEHFGYEPVVSREKAIGRTIVWLRESGYANMTVVG